MRLITLAAEIPNDNPRLHRGARWVCTETTGPARVVHPLAPRPAPDEGVPLARESAIVPSASREDVGPTEETAPATLAELVAAVFEDVHDPAFEDEPVVVEELEPLDAELPLEGALAGLRASDGAAEVTEVRGVEEDPYHAFVRVLVDVAAAHRGPAAAACLEALFDGRSPAFVSEEVSALLASGDVTSEGRVSHTFEARRCAWREILAGRSDDFEACGSAMLDDWAADVLARALGTLAQQPALKRELRARGVAAFGLVDVAA